MIIDQLTEDEKIIDLDSQIKSWLDLLDIRMSLETKDISNPFLTIYLTICNEVIRCYEEGKVSNAIRQIFGDKLEVSNDPTLPLPVTYISKLMGMGNSYITGLLQRYDRFYDKESSSRPMIYFNSFAEKIDPALSRAFGKDIASEIINTYLLSEGPRHQLFYKLYKILSDETKRFPSYEDFSEIYFQSGAQVSVMLRTSDPMLNDLNQMWRLEYLIDQMQEDPSIGLYKDALERVQTKAKKVIREVMVKQFAKSLSPVAVNMLLDSLRALSQKGGYYSFARLSESIDNYKSKLYLTGKVFGAGRNPADSVVQNLLSLLVSQGVSPNDMSVQWTEMFLKTRGVDFIDFDFYKKELTFLSGQRVSSKSVLTTEQKFMVKTITWSLTCGRSWLTGEPIKYDETLLHHIYHNPETGKTLYGVDYETLNCLVALKGDKENKQVEGTDWKKYQDRFIYMWQQFKTGNFEEATRFWDKIYRDEFLTERTSRRYLNYWLKIL